MTASNESRLNIDGYSYVGKIRSSKRGGGTCILLKDNIIFREIKGLNDCTLEYCAVEIKMDAGTLIVCSAYKPSNSDNKVFLEDYGNLLNHLKTLKSQGIIIGLDHNFDLLKHTGHSTTQCFLDINFDEALLPVINKPTRITKSSATLIDNMFVFSHLDCGQSMIIYDDLSDHLPCIIDVRNFMTTKVEDKMSWKKIFDKSSIDKLRQTIVNQNWNDELQHLDANKVFVHLHEKLQCLIEQIIPTRLVHTKHRKVEPWLTKGILQSIRKQKRLYSKWAKDKTNITAHQEYISYRNILKKLRRFSKRKYYLEKCNEYKSNTKKLWRLINKCNGKINDKSNVIDYLNIDGMKKTESSIIANEFARFFSGIGKEYSNKIKNQYIQQNIT